MASNKPIPKDLKNRVKEINDTAEYYEHETCNESDKTECWAKEEFIVFIDITDKDTLGLVPYYVDKTNRYMENFKLIRQSIKNFEYNENIITVKPNIKKRIYKKNESFD